MFPKVIKAAAGPPDLGPGDNENETLPELTAQSNSGSDSGSGGSEDSTTEDSCSVASDNHELELHRNVSSVGWFSSYLPVLISLVRGKATLLMSLRNMSFK